MNKIIKRYPTIGVCGLDCVLCPRYYTVEPSKFPECYGPDFFNKHPSRSFITCCLKKKEFEVCAECSEFPYSKFKSDEEYEQMELSSSYPPDKKIMLNLYFIKEHGVKKFIEQQEKRIRLLETMINNFDDGRSKSFFCKAAALLDLTSLAKSLDDVTRKIKINNIKSNNIKAQAKLLKSILNEVACEEGIELTKKKRTR